MFGLARDLEQNPINRSLCFVLRFATNRYQLLKIVQKYGKIEKFDMLFHRSGPLAGYPRGYAFVTYENVSQTHPYR